VGSLMGYTTRARRARKNHTACFIILLMILSVFTAIPSPVQASISNDDVSIKAAIEPMPGVFYDTADVIDWTPKVTIENQYPFSSDPRTIDLEVCGGDQTAQSVCPSQHVVFQTTAISNGLAPAGSSGDSEVVTFYSFLWFVDEADLTTYSGVFTIMFHFAIEDDNPANDHLRYTVTIEEDLTDLVVNDHNVDTNQVYNSNTAIPADLDIRTRSWPEGFNFYTGWSMHLVNPVVAESTDCVDWEKWHTGQGDMNGNEIILHNTTHYDTNSQSIHAPHIIDVSISSNSQRILGEINVSGSMFDGIHDVNVKVTLNNTELYSQDWQFIGDNTVQNAIYYTDFANGTICFTVTMTVPDIEVGAASHELSGYSGNSNSLNIPLPDIVAPYSGIFEVRAYVNGTFIDPNAHNDLITFEIIVNDTTDVWIREVVPARGAPSYIYQGGQYLSRFPYGQDSIRVVSGNIGWVTTEVRVELNLYTLTTNDYAAGPFTCNSTLAPGNEFVCEFDFSTTGAFILNATIISTDGNIDSLPGDNWLEQAIIVDFGAINPSIAYPTQGEVYESGEPILAVASVDPQAPMPLNYTWRMNFMEILGYGQVTNITMPMGEWVLTLYVTDEAGNLEIATQSIRILNRVQLESTPHVVGGDSISTYSMELVFEDPVLPPAGQFYPEAYNRNKEPLAMFNLTMVSPSGQDISVDSINAWMDLDHFLPPAINRSTVEVLRVPDWDDVQLETLSNGDGYVVQENGSINLFTQGDIGGSFMLIGHLDPVVVNPANLTIILQKDGQAKLTWENEGDVENPYFGGWRIYRKSPYRFSFPFETESQFNSATVGYEVLEVPSNTVSWQDPTFWEDDTCLSYLVMSHNRAGVTDWRFGNVSNAVWDPITERMVVDEVCVDDSNPETIVDSISASVSFNNNTKLHSIHISWSWPEIDEQGPLTWNLYRAQSVVPSVTYLEPVLTNLQGEPGQMYWFNETESGLKESIHVGQFYYYVLVPFDEVGNSDYLVRQNAVGVTVVDQFWEYHLAPPPPEEPDPPSLPGVGPSEWYGRLVDDFNSDRFQQAGVVCLAVTLLNILMIPMLINKYKEQRVKIKRKRARQRRFEGDSDLADDLDDFFD